MSWVSRKKISSRLAYENPFFKVWEDDVVKPTGQKGKYYWLHTYPAVFVIPMNEKGEIYLIGQYRYPVKQYNIEVVAGGTDGQNALAAAKRELWEEAGLEAKNWKKIGEFCPWTGLSCEIDNVFLATGLSKADGNKQLEEGIDQVVKVTFKKALTMIKSGKIRDGQSVAALTMAGLHLKLIK